MTKQKQLGRLINDKYVFLYRDAYVNIVSLK